MPEVLLVDDDGESCLSLARALKASGIDAAIHAVTSAAQALEHCERSVPAVAVIDLSLDERRGVESGFELLRSLVRKFSQCRSIVLTGHGGSEHGVRALQLGAGSFLQKPASIPHLAALIQDGFIYSELRRSAVVRDQEVLCAGLIGESAPLQTVRETLRFAARTNQAVFISGETGTGKGVCAQLLHRLSSRAQENFVRYQPNFTGPDLVNSDLFGHKKGAFTGATDERRGLFAEADGGTLFLDEIDELPLESQVTLLGVLQEKRFRPVGSSTEERTDFRLVAASNCKLEKALEQGKIRQDLYHRIAQVVIHLPPLRNRLDDIAPLATHFLKQLAAQEELHLFSLEAAAMEKLTRHSWPGNVRELQSVIESAAFKGNYRGATAIAEEDISIWNAAQNTSRPEYGRSFSDQVEAYKVKLIEEALNRCGGNQVQAASELKLDRSTLRRIMARST